MLHIIWNTLFLTLISLISWFKEKLHNLNKNNIFLLKQGNVKETKNIFNINNESILSFVFRSFDLASLRTINLFT